MAIANFGLTSDPLHEWWDYGLRIYEKDDKTQPPTGHPIKLTWTTDFDNIESTDRPIFKDFEFTLRFRGYQKGSVYATNWSETRTAKITPDQCTKITNDGTYHWAEGGKFRWECDLNIGNSFEELSGGAWLYKNRIYDSIELDISMRGNFTPEYTKITQKYDTKTKWPPWGWHFFIGYVPEIKISQVVQESSDLVAVYYSTSWTRVDDRFNIEAINLDSRYGKNVLLKKYWAENTAMLKLTFPTSVLSQHIAGKRIYLRIRWNAKYRPIEESERDSKFTIAEFNGYCQDMSKCNTPYLVPRREGENVVVYAGDSKDLGYPIDKITVKLVDGKYSVDEVTVPPNREALFPFCPFTKTLHFEAVASYAFATSEIAYGTCAPLNLRGQYFKVDSLNGNVSQGFTLRASKAGPDITTEGNFETVELKRRRPSAFYGVGATTKISMTGVLIEDVRGTEQERYVSSGQQIEDIVNEGDVMLRFPDGRRYAIAPKVEIRHKLPNFREITISGDEVDA